MEQPLAVVGSGDFKIQRIKRNGIVSEITLVNLGEGDVKKLVLKFFQSQAELKEAAKRGEIGAFAASRFA
ncbi:MAG: hypothetical protein GTN80_01045, partial [Nitrososphaeria archaeon]|nr:hypothetical protein [Nitrososphaeria archaeon]